MILSDRDIRRYLEEGKIKIEPAPNLERQLGPCSIDLRLGRTFRVFARTEFPFIDLRNPSTARRLTREVRVEPGHSFVIHPGDFVLASTMEWLEIPDDILARLEGRSSLGRLGIHVHSTASVFYPGWAGTATMELGNLGVMPVALYPGIRVCAFTFSKLSSPAEVPYGAKRHHKYHGQRGPEASRIWTEVEGELEELVASGSQLALFGAQEPTGQPQIAAKDEREE